MARENHRRAHLPDASASERPGRPALTLVADLRPGSTRSRDVETLEAQVAARDALLVRCREDILSLRLSATLWIELYERQLNRANQLAEQLHQLTDESGDRLFPSQRNQGDTRRE